MPETQRRDVCQVVVVESLTLLTGPIDDIADFDGSDDMRGVLTPILAEACSGSLLLECDAERARSTAMHRRRTLKYSREI